MSIHQILYGDAKYIPFKLVNGSNEGVNIVLQNGDVWISRNTGSGFSTPTWVTNLPQLINQTLTPGCYSWLPTVTECSCECFMINIRDQTSPAQFIQNSLVIACGGNAAAFFDAGN